MWYSVEALFRCDVQDGLDSRLYEKTIFLIEADDNIKKASKKAKRIALSFETKYKNDVGNEVSWRLVKVLEIHDLIIEKLYDGVEVFSSLLWENEIPEELRRSDTPPQKKQRSKK